jgi:hypothetical protein
MVEGVVNNNILYLSNDEENPVCCNNQEVPFKHSVDIKGIKQDMACEAGLDVEHCNYSMVSGNEVEIRLVMSLNVKVVSESVIPLVVRVNETPIDSKLLENQPSITIYFTKPGDSLWNIAKRYYTTVDDLRNTNNINDRDGINPGQQVIIPRKIS